MIIHKKIKISLATCYVAELFFLWLCKNYGVCLSIFFQGQYLFLVVICSIDTKSKISASIIMMTQQKTTEKKSREKMLYLILLKVQRWCVDDLQSNTHMNLKYVYDEYSNL